MRRRSDVQRRFHSVTSHPIVKDERSIFGLSRPSAFGSRPAAGGHFAGVGNQEPVKIDLDIIRTSLPDPSAPFSGICCTAGPHLNADVVFDLSGLGRFVRSLVIFTSLPIAQVARNGNIAAAALRSAYFGVEGANTKLKLILTADTSTRALPIGNIETSNEKLPTSFCPR